MPGDKPPGMTTAASFTGKVIEYTHAFVGAGGKVAAKYRFVCVRVLALVLCWCR